MEHCSISKDSGNVLGRYTTGREGSGLLISYVRKNEHQGNYREVEKRRWDAELPENQVGLCADHSLKWSLMTRHT